MTPKQLRTIVNRHGGTGKFAARLKVSQRIVQYWLTGKRWIRPIVADRIRELEPPDHPTMLPAIGGRAIASYSAESANRMVSR